MQKLTAAIIKKDDYVLLIQNKNNLNQEWQFPGGKVNQDEENEQCLKRELRQQLNIVAQPGRIITSVKTPEFNAFAYDIPDYKGQIKICDNYNMKWVSLWNLNQQTLCSPDKKILENIMPYSELPDLETKAHEFACSKVKSPRLNKDEQKPWCVSFQKNGKEKCEYFFSGKAATEFYTNLVKKIMESYKRYQILNIANSTSEFIRM